MARTRRKRLGEILVGWGVVTPTQIDEALEYASQHRIRLGEALAALGAVDEDDLTKALANQFDMEYIDLDQTANFNPDLDLMDDEVIRKYMVLPVSKEGNRMKVIITDPLDLETLDMLRFRLNCDLEPCLASRAKMRNYIDSFVRSGISLDSAVSDLTRSVDGSVDVSVDIDHGFGLDAYAEEDLDESSAPIIRLVTLIISEAVNMRASDIHVEPASNRVRVRYRIDGVCIERDNIPKAMQGPVLNRFKIMAGMHLEEKRLPQDGRIKMPVGSTEVDFRVSALPSYYGESIVLRILHPESAKIGIQSLGFEQEDYDTFLHIIRRPNGVFLVTGPTGSGKTTTLYSALNELNRPDRKIITAEDPIEYNFTGINQVQVNEAIGLGFPEILRSMLRQAPNIILVGEIRDFAVAEVAIQAALTGHLVFSTLHTNDAPSSITRLIDMGVKPFLVASSIQAAMAQRLVRTICPDCKEPHPGPDPSVLRLLGFTEQEARDTTFYRGAGCNACAHTGCRGRIGIFEMMIMNSALRELAFERAPLGEIRRAARAAGMKALVDDARIKIRRGVIAPEEVARVTQVQQFAHV